MGYSTNEANHLPTTYFKINGLKKGSTEIYFKGEKKSENGYKDIGVKPTYLFGHLTKVEVGEYEYEGSVKKTVKLVLEDEGGREVLEGGFSNLMVNLINTLAGNDDPIDTLNIGVYIKNGYSNISIKINGKDWKDNKWKYDYKKDLAPLIEEVKNKKGEVLNIDKTELVDFLTKEIESEEFQSKIAGNPPSPKVNQESSTQEASVDDSDVDEDLPF